MLFWLMGDLSHAEVPTVASVVLCVVLAGSWAGGVQLDLLSLGDAKAESLGLRVPLMGGHAVTMSGYACVNRLHQT